MLLQAKLQRMDPMERQKYEDKQAARQMKKQLNKRVRVI